MACTVCRSLLSEGLDLCVRARKMDAIDRREATLSLSGDADGWVASGQFDRYVERHNIQRPHVPISRSGTMHLWMQEQYDTDLAAWEERSRKHLMQGCSHPSDTPPARKAELWSET